MKKYILLIREGSNSKGIHVDLECSSSLPRRTILTSSQRMLKCRESSLNYELSWYTTNHKENNRHRIAKKQRETRWPRHELYTQLQCVTQITQGLGYKSLVKKQMKSPSEKLVGGSPLPDTLHQCRVELHYRQERGLQFCKITRQYAKWVSRFGEACPKPKLRYSFWDNFTSPVRSLTRTPKSFCRVCVLLSLEELLCSL